MNGDKTIKPDLVLEIPYLPPSSYSPNSRTTHWQRTKDRDRVTADLKILLAEAFWHGPRMDRCRAEVVFSLDNRRRDSDNLQARTKVFWDALQILDVILGDDLDLLGWPEYGHIRARPDHTTIKLFRIV